MRVSVTDGLLIQSTDILCSRTTTQYTVRLPEDGTDTSVNEALHSSYG